MDAPASSDPSRNIRYQPDEAPPRLLSLGLGLQYVVLAISGIVLTPAIVIRSAGGSEEYLTWAVFAALCVCGVCTVLQAKQVGRIGAGYILLMGTSGAFIAACVSALEEGGPGLMATLVVASSLFQFAFASRLSMLRRLITPLLGGLVIMLISVTVMPIGYDMLLDIPEGAVPVGAPLSALATLVCSVALGLLGKGAWRLWAPVLGIVAGCSVSAFYGLFDGARVAAAPWIGLPGSAWPGLSVDVGPAFWGLLPVFVLATMVGAIETVGDAVGIQQISWRNRRATDFRAVQGAVTADGVGNLLSGLLGTVPNTTYSSPVAITELTGVASRSVGVAIGVLFGAIAFLPKLSALILAIPSPVVAAYLLLLLGMLFALGMRIVVQDGIDYRKAIVVGVAYWLGTGFQAQELYPEFLGESLTQFLSNGMTSGGLAAVLMIILMNLGNPRRRKLEARLDVKSLPKIEEFLRTFAKDMKWSRPATRRLCAAAEEALLSLSRDGDGADGPRFLLLVVQGTGKSAELEFNASAIKENLEDRLKLLGQWAEESSEREVSLRLLRHYATSVRHQQYHEADVVSITVDAAAEATPNA